MDVAPPQPVSQAGEITASPRDRLIEAATRLFCRYGVNSVGPALRLWFAREDFYGCPFINAVAESDKADHRMRSLAIAHKKVVLERLATLCGEAGLKEPTEVAHSLGLIIDGAIVAALVTGDPSVADTAGRSCAAILSQARG